MHETVQKVEHFIQGAASLICCLSESLSTQDLQHNFSQSWLPSALKIPFACMGAKLDAQTLVSAWKLRSGDISLYPKPLMLKRTTTREDKGMSVITQFFQIQAHVREWDNVFVWHLPYISWHWLQSKYWQSIRMRILYCAIKHYSPWLLKWLLSSS